jgi:hypothetical protein
VRGDARRSVGGISIELAEQRLQQVLGLETDEACASHNSLSWSMIRSHPRRWFRLANVRVTIHAVNDLRGHAISGKH